MASTMTHPTTAPKPSPGGLRFVPVRANLMPNEIITKRQTEVVRKQVLIGLLAVIVVIIGWFGVSWWQTHSANSDLDSARHHAAALQSQQQAFAPLVTAQTQTQAISAQLHKLMTGDLSWKAMLTTLRTQAPSGITLTTVTGTVASTTGATTTGQQPAVTAGGVGQLTLTGTARNKNDVAAYSDKLARVKGLASPLITNVATTGSTVTFSMTAAITADALGGRYAATVPTTKTGGK